MQYLDQFHILDLHQHLIVTYTYIMFHEILFKGYLVMANFMGFNSRAITHTLSKPV